MAFQYAQIWDEIPLFKAAFQAIGEMGKKLGGIVQGALEGAGSVSHSSVAGVSHSEGFMSAMSNIKEAFSREKSPEIAPVREQEIAIAAPTPPRVDPHAVDMHEFGQFSPPTFGGSAGGRSLGGRA